MTFLDVIHAAMRRDAQLAAEARERVARRAIVARLPAGLRWLADHPLLLRALYRMRPALRPVLVERVGLRG